MSPSTSGLGSFKDSNKSSHLPHELSLYEYGSSLLAGYPTAGGSSVCLDIMVYLEGRNNKVFSNLDMDPKDTLKLAETEATLWAEAQLLNEKKTDTHVPVTSLPAIPGRWCFTDGSWKEGDLFSGQGWFSTLKGFEGLLGARNVRASLNPLHAEMEALLWAMECMRNLRQSQVTFATDCSQLVKMVSKPEEWQAFASYLEDIKSHTLRDYSCPKNAKYEGG